MLLLHFSDLHLGVDLYGSPDPTTGLSTRVGDFLRALDTIVDAAISKRVDAVLFTGDAFKNREPNPTLQRELARRVMRLRAADIPLVILVGNHDLPNATSRAAPTEIYSALDIGGVYVARMVDAFTLPTRSGPLQIVALPWITRQLLLSNAASRKLNDLALDEELATIISMMLGEMAAELDPTLPAVFLGHLSVQGATLGNERSVLLTSDVVMSLDALHHRSYDYVALGHIHRRQQIGTVPPAWYAGSPERVDFGEEREDKGYLLVTIEQDDSAEPRGRRTTVEPVDLDARTFLTLRIDGEQDEPMPHVLQRVKRDAHRINGAIVRVIVRTQPGRESEVRATTVRRALQEAGAAVVANVIVESERTDRDRLGVSEAAARDSMSMLTRWVETKPYSDALRRRVLDLGANMIRGQHAATGGNESTNG